MDQNAQFSIQQCPSSLNQTARIKGILYAEAIGSILWPTVVSRLDTAFVVGVLLQFIQNPGPTHWDTVKRVISYLGSTKDLWLTFGGTKHMHLEGYSDADWALQPHQHLISGFSFHYGMGAVSWSSKKQSIIVLLSTEAEYVAETHAAKEALWLQTFVNEVTGIVTKPLTVMCDNQGAMSLVKDNKFHSCTKHIDLCYHFVHEAVKDGKIALKYIPSSDNIADIFTKPLAKTKFAELVPKLGLGVIKD